MLPSNGVRYIARRIHERLPQHVPFEDLVHSGVLGLIDALNKFDVCKHVQFASYAKHRIRGAILDSLRELDWSPRELRRKARLLEQTHARLDSVLGRTASERWTSFSVAKSVTSTLVGAAVADGYIKSVDDPVTKCELTSVLMCGWTAVQ